MFKSYFTIALRTIVKNKLFSAINVLGLAIGVSASLVIYLLVSYQFSFNKFGKHDDRIYRVVSDFNFSGEVYHNPGVILPMGDAVRKEVPGIESVVQFFTWDSYTKVSIPVKGKEQPGQFKKQANIVYADSAYFTMVDYRWIEGNPHTALLRPFQVVLSASNASLYFPGLTTAQVIGKELYFNDTIRTIVTGVVDNLPYNTDFTFKTFVSRCTMEQTGLRDAQMNSWDNTNGASQLYLKLAPNTSKEQVEVRLAAIFKKYHKPEPGDKSITKHTLQNLGDVHFNADYGGYDLPLANKPTLYGLLAVAVFLLVLGCINFINLTTAHSSQRAREIGIRKTVGCSRTQLILQVLSETFVLTLLATILSVVLIPLILKAFSGFIPQGLEFNLLKQPGIIFFLLVLVIAVTLLSGFYPALVLSGFRTLGVLKNQANGSSSKSRKAWLRKSLTVSQFVIAQVFIMATILVSKQITYSLSKDQGFKKEAILSFNLNYYDTVQSRKHVLIGKLHSIPGISMISLCNTPPSSNNTWSSTIKYKDGQKEIETDVQQKFGDSNYIKLYGLQIIAGNNIRTADSVNAFVVNETYAHILGFHEPREAIGKYLEWSDKKIPIVGVVSDFNQHSLHEPIKPLTIGSYALSERNISISLQPQNGPGDNWKTTISKMKEAFKEIYPKDDFEYSFFDDDIAKYYTYEEHVSSLLMWATALAVFISCLGLLGLAIYTTSQRTKEIGVRKVLGASVLQIVVIITREFLALIIIAFAIAAPLALIGMHKWLETFVYRTAINWWIFVLGGGAMIIIALFTLSFQTIRSATVNPVKSLRSE